jgi:hypothetical protein
MPSTTGNGTESPLLEIHERILQGSPEALEDLAGRLLPVLCGHLRNRFRRAPEEFLVDAVEDAILEYAMHAHRFDVSRGTPLDRFLYHAAWRNVVNLLQAESKRKAREARYSAEAIRLKPDDGEPDTLHQNATDRGVRVLVQVAGKTERSAFLLWLRGERRTEILARALGLSHLEPQDQRGAVKRFKDRLVKRLLRRHARGQGDVRS